jgi:hypothetical protein
MQPSSGRWQRGVTSMADKKNIFISHVHKDDDLLPKLKDLIGNAGMEVRDGSINSDKPRRPVPKAMSRGSTPLCSGLHRHRTCQTGPRLQRGWRAVEPGTPTRLAR